VKLIALKLKNFRQFVGEHAIAFGNSAARPITIFHGINGGGKSALLNALTWSLYGSTTPSFKHPERRISNEAMRAAKEGEKVEASVEIEFEHVGNIYKVKRTATQIRRSGIAYSPDEETDLLVRQTRTDGKTTVLEAPQVTVDQVLPEQLHSFFFFDGERIEHLTKDEKSARGEIARATKNLMMVEIVDRLYQHLNGAPGIKGVRKEFEDDLYEDAQAELKTNLDRKRELESGSADAQKKLTDLELELAAGDSEIAGIDTQLRALLPSQALQAQRKALLQELETNENSEREIRVRLSALIRNRARYIPVKGAALAAVARIKGLEREGELPAPVKRQFVEGLLRDAMCICGRVLSVENGSRQQIESWQQRSGLADIESRALTLKGSFQDIEQRVASFWEDRGVMANQLNIAVERKDGISYELKDVSEKLKSLPQEDIGKLEDRREALQGKRKRHQESMQEIKFEEGKRRDEMKKIDAIVEKAASQVKKNEVIARQLHVCGLLVEATNKVRAHVERQVRENCQKKIREVFKRMAFKGYDPVLTQEFGLELYKGTGPGREKVSSSSGEITVLALAFVSSIVSLLRERKEGEMLGGRVEYPIVMDSPFGQLDPSHRRRVGSTLQELAPQIIIFVGPQQWDKDLESSMRGRIAKRYAISFAGTRDFTPDDAEEATIVSEGKSYKLYHKSPTGQEFAELLEIK